MANFNKVFLMGNLTRDPQLSYLPSQTAVVDFGLAVNRRWKSRDGEDRNEVCFVDCRAFGRQAENINKYLTKGRAFFVEGRLTFDTWTAQDGSKRSKHRVTVENFQFLGGLPPDGSAEQGFNQRGSKMEPGTQMQNNAFGGSEQVYDQTTPTDDDIPF